MLRILQHLSELCEQLRRVPAMARDRSTASRCAWMNSTENSSQKADFVLKSTPYCGLSTVMRSPSQVTKNHFIVLLLLSIKGHREKG